MHCSCNDKDCDCRGKCQCMECCCRCLHCFTIRATYVEESDATQNDCSTTVQGKFSGCSKSPESIASDESVSDLNRTGTSTTEDKQQDHDFSCSTDYSEQGKTCRKYNFDSECLQREFSFLFEYIEQVFPGRNINISDFDMIHLKIAAFENLQNYEESSITPATFRKQIMENFNRRYQFQLSSVSCEVLPESNTGKFQGRVDTTTSQNSEIFVIPVGLETHATESGSPVLEASSETDAPEIESPVVAVSSEMDTLESESSVVAVNPEIDALEIEIPVAPVSESPRNSSESTSGNIAGTDFGTENLAQSRQTAQAETGEETLLIHNDFQRFLSKPFSIKTPVEIADSLPPPQITEDTSLKDLSVCLIKDVDMALKRHLRVAKSSPQVPKDASLENLTDDVGMALKRSVEIADSRPEAPENAPLENLNVNSVEDTVTADESELDELGERFAKNFSL